MIGVGARIIRRGGQAETAEAARLNASSEASALDVAVNNISECLTDAITSMAQMEPNATGDVKVQLNTQYWEQGLTQQDASLLLGMYDRSMVSAVDVVDMLRKGKIQIDPNRDNDEIVANALSSRLESDLGEE
jgi:hypothetical protein